MDTSRTSIILLCGLLLTGCNQAGQRRELVERELRLQEDRIFKLQAYIHEYQDLLDSCRRENDSLKRELGIEATTAAPPATGSGPPSERAAPFQPPVIEPGIPALPGNEILPGELPAPDDADLGELSKGPVKELVINQLLTGGLSTDAETGDEGIMVVVEPRAADGKLVRQPGELSVMLVDPSKSGPTSRVARWDFSSVEAAAAFRKSPLGRGVHLELPWPADPPQTDTLELYVRVVTPAGKKLIAEAEIGVDPDGTPIEERLPILLPASHAVDSEPAEPERWSERTEPLPVEVEPAVVEEPVSEEASDEVDEATEEAQDVETAARPEWKPYR